MIDLSPKTSSAVVPYDPDELEKFEKDVRRMLKKARLNVVSITSTSDWDDFTVVVRKD